MGCNGSALILAIVGNAALLSFGSLLQLHHATLCSKREHGGANTHVNKVLKSELFLLETTNSLGLW